MCKDLRHPWSETHLYPQVFDRLSSLFPQKALTFIFFHDSKLNWSPNLVLAGLLTSLLKCLLISSVRFEINKGVWHLISSAVFQMLQDCTYSKIIAFFTIKVCLPLNLLSKVSCKCNNYLELIRIVILQLSVPLGMTMHFLHIFSIKSVIMLGWKCSWYFAQKSMYITPFFPFSDATCCFEFTNHLAMFSEIMDYDGYFLFPILIGNWENKTLVLVELVKKEHLVETIRLHTAIAVFEEYHW